MYASRSQQAMVAGWDPFMTDEQIADIVAHYCGMVTEVDTWFGRLLDKLDELDLSANTVVFFTGDHGTNFADNPWEVMGKPHH